MQLSLIWPASSPGGLATGGILSVDQLAWLTPEGDVNPVLPRQSAEVAPAVVRGTVPMAHLVRACVLCWHPLSLPAPPCLVYPLHALPVCTLLHTLAPLMLGKPLLNSVLRFDNVQPLK